ncbi:MAG: hypothetical protein ACI4PW_00495 [Alphaproteobacteria bacterium]|jgi:hypothetical protein
MRRALIFIAAVLLILSVAGSRRLLLEAAADHGDRILVPVYVQSVEPAGKTVRVRFRYHTVVPATQVSGKGGMIVVRRRPSGRIVFVRSYRPGEPLRPREHLLKYRVAYDGGLSLKTETSRVKFAADVFTAPLTEADRDLLSDRKKWTVRYAVLDIGRNGDAVLSGLADGNGVLLMKR